MGLSIGALLHAGMQAAVRACEFMRRFARTLSACTPHAGVFVYLAASLYSLYAHLYDRSGLITIADYLGGKR